MTGPSALLFLDVLRDVATAQDWNRGDWPKLWLYNAHYFDDLVATDSDLRQAWHRALLRRWIVENPPGHGNGWEPYPTSLRIVNWVKWALAGNLLDDAALHSLAVQARWLRRRLETHLLGNHLWANAKALVFAGAFFAGEEGNAWISEGLTLLEQELREQILSDGGHFERSPMYHAIVLEDVLDLVQLSAAWPAAIGPGHRGELERVASRMLRWLRIMSHPDGGITFFNDAALGIAPALATLADYAAALGVPADAGPRAPIESLPDSGYVRLEAGPAVLIADVGPVGPPHLTGHAHADTLSFELSVGGRRVLVNGGTSTYEGTAERLRQRGTAMHNTVQVDGHDSSEVWSSFRTARRAQPLDVRWGRDGAALWIEAAHDGYRRLPGCVTHRRRWLLTPKALVVLDSLDGRFRVATAHYRFAPGVTVGRRGPDGESAPAAGPMVLWSARGHGDAVLRTGEWHPRFGVAHDCDVLAVSSTGPPFETAFCWSQCP